MCIRDRYSKRSPNNTELGIIKLEIKAHGMAKTATPTAIKALLCLEKADQKYKANPEMIITNPTKAKPKEAVWGSPVALKP